MPIPIDQRKKPTAVKIHVKTGAGVNITWADGHSSHYDFTYLRDQCPCATCNDERGKKEAMPVATTNLLSSPLLPMYKPKPRAQAATQVGNYAVQISFTDGHSTGIFSYDYLRTLCPCEECGRAFRESPEKSQQKTV
jgi:prepilin-type processing-associated H-X9-DG protein